MNVSMSVHNKLWVFQLNVASATNMSTITFTDLEIWIFKLLVEELANIDAKDARRDDSRVDYLIVSSQLFPIIYGLCIDDFNALLSLCHRSLGIKFHTPAKQLYTRDLSGFANNGSNLSKIPKCKHENSLQF